jgi:hypothetical protein
LRKSLKNKLYNFYIDMSSSASNAAALRRRAAPPAKEPSKQQQQGRVPSGKLAGQHAALQQQTQMKQALQQQQQQQVLQNKPLTVLQAITLITLRLGKVETSLMELEQRMELGYGQNNEYIIRESDGTQSSIEIQDILARLESLEKRNSAPASSPSPSSNQELVLLKQQLDAVKAGFVQSKNMIITSSKEAKEAKAITDKLHEQINSTSQMVSELQTIVFENSQKITNLELGTTAATTTELDFNYGLDDLSSINLNEIIHQEMETPIEE